ncbi:MAG: transporter [Endomicrobiales bacterium]|nr:transporter [Endomicrobiales bacterium]
MKNYFFKVSLVLILFLSLSAGCLQARINILDTWHPGQDSAIKEVNSYQLIASFRTGEYFSELPFHFSYVISQKAEAGGYWGVKTVKGKIGLNDLKLGVKYQFLDGSGDKPAVISEIAISLPTGDHKRALGTGGVGLQLHWALEKEISSLIGYFGLGFETTSENPDKLKLGNVFYYHIGTSFPYQKNYRVHTEIKGYNHADNELNGTNLSDSYQEVYFAPGINYKWVKNRIVSVALLFGLTKQANDLGFLISCNY